MSEKTLSDSTIKAYKGRLDALEMYILGDKMNNREGYYEFSPLKWQDNIEYLKNSQGYKNMETRKGVLSALLWKIGDKDCEAYKKTHEYFNQVKHFCNLKAKQQKLAGDRLERYLTKDELMDCYNLCYAKWLADGRDYYDHLILALYIIQPPARADYCGMEITEILPVDYTRNYCWLKPEGTCYFIFNEYKTKKTYGTIHIPIEKDLLDLIKEHYHTRKEKYVLPEFWAKSFLCDKVRNITAKYTGKECSIGLIRHAWIIDFYKTNPSILQKEEMAKKMLHSVAVQELYRTSEELPSLNLED